MAADQVQHEDVPAPRGGHVEVGQAGEGAVPVAAVGVPGAEAPHPQQEGEAHGADGDGFVVEAAADGPHEVGRDDGHEPHGEDGALQGGGGQAEGDAAGPERLAGRVEGRSVGPPALEGIDQDADEGGAGVLGEGALVGQAADEDGGQGAEPGGHVAAHVVEGHAVAGEVVLDVDGRELHARIYGGADGPAEGVPALVVEPFPEPIGSVEVEIFRGAVVEPRVELVDDRAELLDGLEADPVGPHDAEVDAVQEGRDPREGEEGGGGQRSE